MATTIPRTDLRDTEHIAEESTKIITCVLRDENDVAIPDTDLATFTITLYDLRSRAIINSQNKASALNAGIGTVDGSGNVTLTLAPADNAIVGTARQYEDHVLLLEWSWNGGAAKGAHEILLRVRNMEKRP